MKETSAGIFAIFILSVLISSCSTALRPIHEEPIPDEMPVPELSAATAEPPHADQNGITVDPVAEGIGRLSSYPPLENPREIALRVFPMQTEVRIWKDSGVFDLIPLRVGKDRAWYSTEATAALITAPGHEPLVLEMPADTEIIEAKLERPSQVLVKIGEISTEWQPKSVRFSPDGRSIFVTSLGERTALTQFSLEPLEVMRHLDVPMEYRDDLAFVETAILPERREIWLSQMSRNTIHVFDMDSGAHEAAIPVSGIWPKVLLAYPDETRVLVSCWDSDSIVEIDTAARREIRSISVGDTPRGMTFASGGDELLVALFASSGVERINLESGERTALYEAAPGRNYAMRHIVHDEKRNEYYVTAMGAERVYRLSEDGEWLGFWEVGEKPNTCVLSPDARRLFVSCRGPNNPDIGYLYKGYEFGKVYIINLEDGVVEDWIWGRDQCTGIDVSSDGKYLAFSDFLSANLELYAIR